MNIAIYLSLPKQQLQRLRILDLLLQSHTAGKLLIDCIFVSGDAAKLSCDPNHPLSQLLALHQPRVAICSTAAEALDGVKWPIEGLGTWVEASTKADRALSL